MDPVMVTGSALIGLLVGTLVGSPASAEACSCCPADLGFGCAPIVAVGSDAISCITKIGAGAVHCYHGNVRWPLVLRLACGSVPGAVVGVLVIVHGVLAGVTGLLQF
jgi:uncharacterized protein